MKEKINEIVLRITIEFFDNSDYEYNELIDINFPLIGNSTPLDSIGLVSIIVEIEEAINDEFNVELILASEKAMSARISPFTNLKKLALFIESELNQAHHE